MEKVVPGGSLQIILMAMLSIFSIKAIVLAGRPRKRVEQYSRFGRIKEVYSKRACSVVR